MTYSHPPAEVATARRLLGLDAHARPAEVEAAVHAARSAIVVTDDDPELAATAAHLHRRLDHARAVLLATAPPPPAGPVPPMPPAPPVQMAPAHRAGAAPAPPGPEPMAVPVGGGRPVSGRRRSEFSRAGVQAVAIIAGLLLLGGGAFAVTRALSRPGGAARGTAPSSTTTTTTTSTPSTTRAAKTFPARVVAGELGHPTQGLDAPGAEAALVAWLGAFEAQDATTVSLGIGGESRLTDLAEIGSMATPADLDAVTCNVFGSGTWVCRAGAVTSAKHKVEVADTPEGWRVLGWFG